MVEALVSVVARYLFNMAKDEAMLLACLKKKLEDLSHELRTIKAVLQDAEMKQVRVEAIRIWLQNLKFVAYEIEDLIEESDQVRNFSSPLSYAIHPIRQYKFGHKIDAIKEKLEKISSEKDRYHFRENPLRETDKRQTSSFVEQSSVIGRDEDKQILRRKLIEEDLGCRKNEVPTIAITGMGGVGKTTLAQIVFNATKSYFEKCIWVCVSNDFNFKDIMINIVKNGGGNIDKDDQVELIQHEVIQVIGKVRYLLILDDVWNEDELLWEPLQNILNHRADGSRIIITTRNRGVAFSTRSVFIHNLGVLSRNKCWSIFQKNVFEEGNENKRYEHLEDLGRQIVEKCGGIPLAVKTISSALRKKFKGVEPAKEQLEDILNSKLWDVSLSDVGILPALMLSYIELPPQLKNCFCYCAIFVKDSVFEKEELVKLRVAQGYVEAANDEHREIECKGEEYFNELFDRSLFQ